MVRCLRAREHLVLEGEAFTIFLKSRNSFLSLIIITQIMDDLPVGQSGNNDKFNEGPAAE